MRSEENPEPCRFPECTTKSRLRIRGLCASCYYSVAQMVKRGKTTWEQLEKDGKIINKKHRSQRKRQNLLDWINVKDKE